MAQNEERTRITIELPTNLHDAVLDLANANDRSLSAEVRVALREHVERTEEGSGS